MRDGGDFALRDVPRFNGGLFVRPDLYVIRERRIPFDVVTPVIDIIDRGPGIAPEGSANIFEMPFRWNTGRSG